MRNIAWETAVVEVVSERCAARKKAALDLNVIVRRFASRAPGGYNELASIQAFGTAFVAGRLSQVRA